MKVITVDDFEARFEEVIDDCADNHVHYRIQLESGESLMLIPADDYGIFQAIQIAAIIAAELSQNFKSAIALAADSVDNGRALTCLRKLIEISNR